MAFKEGAALMKAGFIEQLDKIESVRNEYVSKIEAIDQMVAEYDADLAAEYQRGKESVVLPSPTDPAVQFTQADMDRVALVAKEEKAAELQPQIDALALKVAELEGRVDTTPFGQADMDAAVEAKRAEMQAVIAGLETRLSEKDADALEEAVAQRLRAFADELSARTVPAPAEPAPIEPEPEAPAEV